MQTKALTESSLLTALFVILAMATVFIPALSAISLLLLSLPHAFISYKHGVKTGIISLVVSSFLLVLLLGDIVTAFTTVTMFASVGVALGAGVKKLSAGKTIMLGAVVGGISFAILITVVANFLKIDIYGDTIKIYEQSLKAMTENGWLAKALKGVDYSQIENMLQLAKGVLKPSLVLGVGFMVSYINYKMFQIVGARFKIKVPRMKSLFEWTFPVWVGVVFVLGNILVLLGANNSLLYSIGLNIHIVFQWPVILQGMSLMIMFFSKYIRSKIFFILLIILVFMNPLLLKIVSFVGLFDMLFNYRSFVLEKGDKK